MARRRGGKSGGGGGKMRLVLRKHTPFNKVHKGEGRVDVKKRMALKEKKYFELPKGMELEKSTIGCVGQVTPGVIVRLNTHRVTQFGHLYYFDGFKLDENKNMVWIGEFDILDIDKVAEACGDEVRSDQFGKVLIPDDSGMLQETVGDLVIEEGAGDLRSVE